jgi:poly-gamma-glutamate synthesis protein (capsule biosynthesis protein)
VAALQALGCDIVSLNNNHILDYHSQGFKETLTHLAANNIQYFGAGETRAVAKAPLQVDVNGLEITFVGYTTDAPNVDAPLAIEEPVGGASIDREQICSDVQSLRAGTDIVCVVFHWGHEYIRYPSPDQIATARAVIDAGADLVVGHHPHIVQGYEQYDDGLIFYSLGNFLFSDYYRVDGRLAKWDDENRFGLCPQISFNTDGLTSVEVVVTKQTDTGVTVVDPTVLPFDLNDLCNQIELSDEYERFWSTQKARRERQLERRRLRQRITELGFRGLLQRISMERLRRVGSLALDSIRGRFR